MESREIGMRVSAPHFCAGAIFTVRQNAGKAEWVCTEAAPIIKCMVGWTSTQCKSYCQKKDWAFETVDLAVSSQLLGVKNTISWVDFSKSNAWLFTRKNAESGRAEFVIKQLDRSLFDSSQGFSPGFEKEMLGLGFRSSTDRSVALNKTRELVAPVTRDLSTRFFNLPGIEKIEVDKDVVDYGRHVVRDVIILSTYRELDDRNRLYVSHGTCESTLSNVCLPTEPLDNFLKLGARKCDLRGEYVLDAEEFRFALPARQESPEQSESSLRL